MSMQSKGGKARAAALSPEERRDISRSASEARWANRTDGKVPKIPKATHEGELKIGETAIPCAVLSNGQRVITQRGFLRAIGRHENASGDKDSTENSGAAQTPPFLAQKSIKPYISNQLLVAAKPIVFQLPGNNTRAYGYAAELLPRVCQVWLNARDAGALLPHQDNIAKACDALIRGMATVGIIALVDEATGFQNERDRTALHAILEAFIAKELLPWTKRFPDEFYKQMFRLRGWTFAPMLPSQGPRYAGKLTNEIIYERLPSGVLDELRSNNPVTESGYRRNRHHQYLSANIGNPALERHVSAVIALMRASSDWETFEKLFDRAFPSETEGK